MVPVESRTPLAVRAPAVTIIKLEPKLLICSCIRASAPAPTANMVMTAATPIITPNIVNAERSLLTRNAFKAMRKVAKLFMGLYFLKRLIYYSRHLDDCSHH